MTIGVATRTSMSLFRRTKTLFSPFSQFLTGSRYCSDLTAAKTISGDGVAANTENSVSPSKNIKEESTLSKFVRAVELWDEKSQNDNIFEEKTIAGNFENEHVTSFSNLLRNSKLFQLGHPSGRVVVGKIFEVRGDDLYIDFGGKFYCVCKRPQMKPHEYRRGILVKLLLQDFEMSAAFLGSTKHVTLLEADATLIGLRRNPSS